ncbi:MAG: DNA polymerase III subunit delta' [Magnetococcus sp. DMHC-6]
MSILTFDQIVGHSIPLQQIEHSLTGERVPHAQLFFGPPGVGKTTVALAMVGVLFCQENRQAWIHGTFKIKKSCCKVCSSCRKLAHGNHPDLVRVGLEEKKTQIGVDQIRQLSQFLSLTPLEAQWKIAMIEDAALLNGSSANALLKTLEEPSPHSLLILITSRPGRLLPTILSRCRKIRFSALESEDLIQILTRLKPEADPYTRAEAISLAAGNVAKALECCTLEKVEMQKKFAQDVQSLGEGGLADLITLAEYWADPNRFSMALEQLRLWIGQTIAQTLQESNSAGDKKCEEWLTFFVWVTELVQRTQIFNLNRQLVLEGVNQKQDLGGLHPPTPLLFEESKTEFKSKVKNKTLGAIPQTLFFINR